PSDSVRQTDKSEANPRTGVGGRWRGKAKATEGRGAKTREMKKLLRPASLSHARLLAPRRGCWRRGNGPAEGEPAHVHVGARGERVGLERRLQDRFGRNGERWLDGIFCPKLSWSVRELHGNHFR